MMLGLAGVNPKNQYFSPLSEDFTNKGTSDLGEADTGQSWFSITSGGTKETVKLQIINGKLTNTISDAVIAAGYIVANLGGNVRKIGGSFDFDPSSVSGGGVVCFIIWRTLLQTLSMPVPDSPCHLILSDTAWSYSVFENGIKIDIAGGNLSAPLVCDGQTEYSVDVEIINDTATITLPDGTIQTVTDARIASMAGTYACFEVYQNNAATNPKAEYLKVYANS